jgi:hypothetical protein
MAMDETLYGVSEKVQQFAVIYLGESIYPLDCGIAQHWCRWLMDGVVDITEVPDFNKVSKAAF